MSTKMFQRSPPKQPNKQDELQGDADQPKKKSATIKTPMFDAAAKRTL